MDDFPWGVTGIRSRRRRSTVWHPFPAAEVAGPALIERNRHESCFVCVLAEGGIGEGGVLAEGVFAKGKQQDQAFVIGA